MERAASVVETRWVRTLNVVALAALVVSSLFAIFYSVLDLRSLWPVVVTNALWNGGYGLVLVLNGGAAPISPRGPSCLRDGRTPSLPPHSSGLTRGCICSWC